MRNFALLALAVGTAFTVAADQGAVVQQRGDVLAMPAAPAAITVLPTNGMSKAAVQRRFGAPQRKEAAVGEPPISVWHYSDFKVFFEHHLVLHSVSENRKPTVYRSPE